MNTFVAPYLTFNTFLNGLKTIQNEDEIVNKDMLQKNGIPPHEAPRVISVLKRFDIINTDGVVNSLDGNEFPLQEKDLQQLVILLINKFYVELFETSNNNGVYNISYEKALEFMNGHGLNNSTARRGVDFFIRACEYANIPINRQLFNSKPLKKKVLKEDAKRCLKQDGVNESYDRHRIELGNGGYIDIIINVDLFRLSKEKREKIFQAIDVLKELEKKDEEI